VIAEHRLDELRTLVIRDQRRRNAVAQRVVCVLSPLPALTLNIAFIEPTAVGVNSTLIVQAVLTAIELPQLLLCENWWALRPPSVILVMGSATAPVFVTGIDALAAFFS